ncbi:MAG: TonB-dependent receptor plug domain-containing protein [Flavobacteriaceae bacterium]|nr:TonB-dependent receptor plug domain-containing protein [Flavobacteriaceae bacterium]
MRQIVFLIILFITVHLSAQEQKLEYLDEPLSVIIPDLEAKFSVRFAFNNNLLTDKKITLSGTNTLEEILELIKQQTSLEFHFLDAKNIIIKRAVFDQVISTTDLDEVLISNEYLTIGFDKIESDGSIKITPDDLGILPGLTEPDVLQSLQLLPGISSPNESASELHIRGGTPDQNLVLWDGIKMYHQGHFFGHISAFNPYITESINVSRSGTSAKYGDRISGVIDIRSSDKVHDSLTIGIGFNLIQADAFIKTPIVKDKLSLTASVRRSYSDVLKTITFKKMSNKVFQNTKVDGVSAQLENNTFEELENRFYFTDYNFKTVWKPNSKHTISFSNLYVVNKLDYAAKISYVDFDDIEAHDYLDLTNKGFNLKWEALLSNKMSLETSGYSSDYKSKYGYSDTFGSDDSYTSNTINNIIDLGANLSLQYLPNRKNSFKIGYDIVSNSIDYNITTDYNNDPEFHFEEKDNDKLNIHSLFYEYVFQDKKWTFQTGIRASIVSTINKQFIEPRLFLKYKLRDYWSVKTSLELKNQSISKVLSETQNDLGLGNSLWILADKDRPVINNRQFSLGVLYEKQGWKIDIDAYYKKIKGLTVLKDFFTVDENESTFSTGKSESIGVDVLVKKRIKNFRTWLGYSLSKTNYFFSNLNNGNAFLGNFDQTHVISLSNTYTYKNLQLSLGWNAATGKPYTNATGISDESFEIIYENKHVSRLKTYHKLNASVMYDFYINNSKTTKARIGVSFINIYDHKNELEKTFRLDSQYNEVTQEFDYKIIEQTSYGLRFTPNLVFRLNF